MPKGGTQLPSRASVHTHLSAGTTPGMRPAGPSLLAHVLPGTCPATRMSVPLTTVIMCVSVKHLKGLSGVQVTGAARNRKAKGCFGCLVSCAGNLSRHKTEQPKVA
jgi:hypothetical protein